MTHPSEKCAPSLAFTLFALYWVAFGTVAFVSALTGTFSPPFFFTVLLIGATLFFSTRMQWLRAALLPLAPLAGLLSVISVLWLSFGTPTVFTGRDQGSIATAAIMLADTQTLSSHTPVSDAFFAYYGEGRALNFPGFFYAQNGALTPQFPIPYIAWLAAFYSIFGILGLAIANSILFVLFGISLIMITREIALRISDRKYATRDAQNFLLLLLLTSFPFLWFIRHTLSENMAQFLFFFMILQALLFVRSITHKHKTQWHTTLFFWGTLITGFLLTFTRIEGIALFALTFFALLLNPQTNDYLRQRILSHLLIPAIGLLFTLAFVFEKTTHFYKTIVKAILPTGSDSPSQSTPFLDATLNHFSDYLSYGIAPLLVVGAYGIIILWRKKHFFALLPFFIAFPLCIYLINPHITPDAPWMLRRVTFALLPLGILYSSLAILFLKRNHARILALILIGLALPAYITFFPFGENRGLLAQTHTLGEQFTANDLILIDAGVSGNNFAMLPGPLRTLHKKNAAYFFNPEDLTRIDFSKFETIYLIVPNSAIERYRATLGNRLTEQTNYTITTTRLTQPDRHLPWHFPARDTITTQNTIFRVMP